MTSSKLVIDYEFRRKVKYLSPRLKDNIQSSGDLDELIEVLDAIIKQLKLPFTITPLNLKLAVILTQLKVWEPNDRKFIFDIYDTEDIDESNYDYRKGLKLAMKLKTLKEFTILKEKIK